MDREQLSEWYRFRERALATLRAGEVPTRRGCRVARAVQVLELPSFETPRSFELFQIGDGASIAWLGIEKAWLQAEDILKFETPVEHLRWPQDLAPMLEREDGPVAPEKAGVLLRDLQAIHVAIHPGDFREGLDGTSHELTIGTDFGGACFRWWWRPPHGWEPLAAIAQRVKELVSAAVKSARSGPPADLTPGSPAPPSPPPRP